MLIPLMLLCAACSQGPAPGVVATTDSFDLGEDEVMPVAAVLESAQPAADRSGRIEAIRRAARSIAIEKLVLGTIDDPALFEDRYAADLARLRRDAVIGWYLQTEIYPALELEPAEVDGYIEEHAENLSVEGMRLVSHIFRKYREPDGVEGTTRVLEEIADRARAGEAFGLLAEELSQSESRSAQGQLGWIRRGRLAEPVEEVVFGLAPGEISAPVDLGSGAAIFWIQDRVDAREFRSDDVRPLVERRLMIRQANELMREVIPDEPPGEDWIVIESDRVLSEIPTRHPTDIVVKIEEFEVTAGEFRDRVTDQRATDLRLGVFDISVVDAYEEVVLHELLYRHLMASGESVGDEVADRLAGLENEVIVERRAQELIREMAAADAEAIERFFEANRHLYQTPFLLELRMVSIPVGARPGAQVRGLEAASLRVSSGKETLEEAAERFGGRVADLGPVSIEQLRAMDPKVPRLVLDVGASGATVPFQLNRRLNLIEVVGRQEPREQEFEAVRDRVVDDFVHRHQQEIYAELVEELLEDAGFVFFEDRAVAILDRQGVAETPSGS